MPHHITSAGAGASIVLSVSPLMPMAVGVVSVWLFVVFAVSVDGRVGAGLVHVSRADRAMCQQYLLREQHGRRCDARAHTCV